MALLFIGSISFLYYLNSVFSKTKHEIIKYPVYRINGKHIIIGTAHCNNYDNTVHPHIKNEIESCEILCTECSKDNKNDHILNISDLNNNENLELFINYIDKSYLNGNYSFITWLLYGEKFYNNVKHRFPNEKVDLYDITFANFILFFYFGMDLYINEFYKKKKSMIVNLDEEPELIPYHKTCKQIIVEYQKENPDQYKKMYYFFMLGNLYYIFNFINKVDYSISNFTLRILLNNNEFSELVHGRSRLWVPKITKNFNYNKKVLVSCGAAHIEYIICKLYNYKIEEYNYETNLFEQIN